MELAAVHDRRTFSPDIPIPECTPKFAEHMPRSMPRLLILSTSAVRLRRVQDSLTRRLQNHHARLWLGNTQTASPFSFIKYITYHPISRSQPLLFPISLLFYLQIIRYSQPRPSTTTSPRRAKRPGSDCDTPRVSGVAD